MSSYTINPKSIAIAKENEHLSSYQFQKLTHGNINAEPYSARSMSFKTHGSVYMDGKKNLQNVAFRDINKKLYHSKNVMEMNGMNGITDD